MKRFVGRLLATKSVDVLQQQGQLGLMELLESKIQSELMILYYQKENMMGLA